MPPPAPRFESKENLPNLPAEETEKRKTVFAPPPSHQRSLRHDSLMLEGPDLVGKRVRVYWPDDKKWYSGQAKAFDSVTLEHLVRYDDGEERQECLTGLEPLQWELLLPAVAAASSTRAATMLRSALREADPETLAGSLAAAEGLTLVPANNEVGYRGVSPNSSGTFHVRKRMDGKAYELGTFSSAAEAALAYERFLGPAESAKEAAQGPARRNQYSRKRRAGSEDHGDFGVPRCNVSVEAVICESASEDEDGEAIRGAAATLVTATSADGDMAPMCSPPAQAPGGGALKRKRSFHSEEFELSAAGDTISIPVQTMRGRRATVVVTYE